MEQVTGNGLGDQAPDAIALIGHGDSDGTGKNGRNQANLHLRFEVKAFCEKAGLNDPECVNNQVQRENPGERNEEWNLVKGGNPGRRGVQHSRRQETNQDVKIENRAFIQMIGVLLLDQGRTKTVVDERLCHGHEDRKHRNQAELLWQEQPGQDNPYDELDSLLSDSL